MAEEGGFFEVMKDAIGACYEGAAARIVTQGAAELAAALFGESNAYVAYGDGQKSIAVEAPQMEQAVQSVEPQQTQAAQANEAPQQERGGMEI